MISASQSRFRSCATGLDEGLPPWAPPLGPWPPWLGRKNGLKPRLTAELAKFGHESNHAAFRLTDCTWLRPGKAGLKGELKDDGLKFREVILWVQAPPGQSPASRPVARLAVVPVMERLMRSQANDSAADGSPEISDFPGAQGVMCPESSSLGGDMASRRETGGVEDCGGIEEDHPVTRETHELPSTGCGTGDPRGNPNAPDGSGHLPGRLRISVHAKVGTPREDWRRSRIKAQARLAGLVDEAWESDGCI